MDMISVYVNGGFDGKKNRQHSSYEYKIIRHSINQHNYKSINNK